MSHRLNMETLLPEQRTKVRESIQQVTRRLNHRCPVLGRELLTHTSVAIIDRATCTCITIWSAKAWDQFGLEAVEAEGDAVWFYDPRTGAPNA